MMSNFTRFLDVSLIVVDHGMWFFWNPVLSMRLGGEAHEKLDPVQIVSTKLQSFYTVASRHWVAHMPLVKIFNL